MKKLNIILDETTILNFPFLVKLIRRYFLISALTPVFGFILALYFFYSQNTIYISSIGFKNNANEDDSPSSAIAKLLGERTDQLTAQEIVSMAQSQDFFHKVSEALVDHPKYEFMNFNPLSVKKQVPMAQLFSMCKFDRDCQIVELSKVLSGFVSIRQDKNVETKFYVDVKSLDLFTCHAVLKVVAEVMERERIATIKHFLVEQRKISEDLLSRKKKELEHTNYASLSDELKGIMVELQTVDSRLTMVTRVYEEKKYELNRMEITLNQTEKTINSGKSDDERESFNQFEALKNRTRQISQDIHALELNKESLSPQDEQILGQLKLELKEKRNELKMFSSAKRSVANSDQFIEQKDRAANFTEFDFSVLKREFKKIQAEYEKVTKEKEILVSKKIEIDHKMDDMRPAFEYLKLLEGKQVQLQMLESTVIPDLIFEAHSSSAGRFKRATKEKVGLYALLLTFFVMFCGLMIRYLLDSRIYDEYELKRNFEDLSIIGNTPDFN